MNFLDYLLIGMNLSAAYLCAIMIHDAILAGWDKSREVLMSQSSNEFDEKYANEWSKKYVEEIDQTAFEEELIDAMKEQYKQDQLKIQALKEDALHWKTTRQIDLEAANQRIKELEEKLAKYEGKL